MSIFAVFELGAGIASLAGNGLEDRSASVHRCQSLIVQRRWHLRQHTCNVRSVSFSLSTTKLP
jgi:hypothetical protein